MINTLKYSKLQLIFHKQQVPEVISMFTITVIQMLSGITFIWNTDIQLWSLLDFHGRK